MSRLNLTRHLLGRAPAPGQPASSSSHYAVDLPHAEELQAWLGGAYAVEGFLGQGGMGAVERWRKEQPTAPTREQLVEKFYEITRGAGSRG